MGIGNQNGTPTSAGPQPRLVLWLDGSSAIPYVNNAPITAWNDKSGNGHHFVDAGGFNAVLKTSGVFSGPAGTFSGAPETPCVQFDNIADTRLLCSNFELPGDGYSIYFVIKSEDDNYGLFSYATPTNDREMLIYNDNGFRQQMINTLDRASSIGDISDGNWDYGATLLSTSNSSNWEYNRNQHHEGGYNTFNGITFGNSGSAMIGDIQNAGNTYPNDPFVGSIAEIIIYEGRLPRPHTRLLRTYFWVKYGLNGAGNSAWDKYHGNMESASGEEWGGKFYNPIGIGRDNGTPNAGSINEARLEGLVLRVNSGEWTQNRTYLCAGVVGSTVTSITPNSVVTQGLGSLPTVLERWNRLWEITGVNGDGNSQVYQIGFDFGEGIDGDNPQGAENYVLLYRDDETSGDFSILPVADHNKFILDDEIVFRVPKSQLITHGRFYTVGTTDAASSLTGQIRRTWYAYQSGDWSDPLTWTLDGSSAPSYVNPDNDVPNVFDNVYIGAGRNVLVDQTLPNHGELRVFGTLDFASSPQASFTTIGGSGLIRCSSGNFPTGNTSNFADPVFGGTLEFYGSGGFTQSTDLEVNKLKIALSNSSSEITLAADLTTNGQFEVNRGVLRINNTANVSRSITSNDLVLVESLGRIFVSTDPGLTKHRWYFNGDFINAGGQVRFTNRTTASYANYTSSEGTDIVEAFFTSDNNNQLLRANGLTNLSRIVIDKGIDQTYTLSIESSNANFFKLLGRCNYNMGNSDYFAEPQFYNCFALVNGTAEIRENIFIPLHANNGNYNINKTAQLWINGGEATKGQLGGSSNSGGLVPYGILKVSDGVMNSLCESGLTTRDNGLIQVDGGVVNTNSIRTSLLGADNIGGLIINDGVVNVDGNLPGGAVSSYYTFSLTYPGNLFQMTGGTLNITGPTSSGLIFINSDPENTSVSGGTVALDVSDTDNNYKITSRAAFWNLELTRSSTSSTNRSFKVLGGDSGPSGANEALPVQDLVVKNNFIINGANNPKIEMGSAGDPADLYVDGNLTLGNGCEYIHNNNTTHFVGTSNSTLTFGGSSAFPFYDLEVNKDLDSRYVSIQPVGPNPAMDILGTFSLEKGYFDNNNRNVDVRGTFVNRTQFGDGSSTANLRMIGSGGRQDIISDGGVVYSLVINNPDGVSLLNDDLTIKWRLYFTDGPFFVGDNALRFETTDPNPIQSYNSTDEFIVCSGNASAGGVEIYNHSDSQTLIFPVGVSTGVDLKYTWARIYVNSGWSDDGYIRVTPVDTLLSSADLSGTDDYLNYYWKVSATDYDDRPNVSHEFRYHQDDVRNTESNLESGRVLSVLPFTRSLDNSPASSHINFSSNTIYYNGTDQAQANNGVGTLLVDANYSAGAADRFPIGSSPDIFYSRSSTVGAAWDNPSNWNKLSDCTGCSDIYDYHSTSSPASTTEFPEAGDIAIIGFNVDSPYRPHVYSAPVGGIKATQIIFTPLQDASGNLQPRYFGSSFGDIAILRPSLDLYSTSDIIAVAQISGEGAIILRDNVDLGVTDIGDFLAQDSSLVVLSNGSPLPFTFDFLPPKVPNLFLAETSAMLTNDIKVNGNLEIAANSELLINENNGGSIEIDGDLILDKYQLPTGHPKLLFNKRGSLKTVEVHGDVKLYGSSAYIGVSPTSSIPADPLVPWTPDEISAMIWLDATDGVTTSGSNVTAWQDKASGTYIATQSTASKRPTYQVGINGLNTVRFDGTDDFLAIPHSNELNILANDDFEIFGVSKFDNPASATPSEYAVLYGKGTYGSRDFIFYLALGRFRCAMDGGRIGLVAPNNHTSAPNLGWSRRQGNTAYLYNTVGGSISDANVSNATTLNNTHDLTIGAAEDGTDRFMDGDIGELIFVKRSLTTEERQKTEGYLAHKWGLEDELPVGHPYKNNIPYIGVDNTADEARFIVEGDIIQNLTNSSTSNNGLKLYDTNEELTYVNLVLTGDGENEFDNLNGPTPRFWKMVVDKGINISSGFAFNTDVNIDGPANEAEKPIDIQNGLLKLDDPGINIDLSTGGGDFVIPATGGLELLDGALRVTGPETGIILSGSLNIGGGSLNIGNAEGVSNYIEYGGGSSPKINITDGTLLVGSQIRRNISSTGGALDYRQSGGTVLIGRYSSPEPSRGMLEVLNPGSRFDHTGGTLTFVRGVNTSVSPSLLLAPTTYNVTGASEIIIGNADSPSGAAIQNFGIQSAIPLNSLTINSVNEPIVSLISNSLELEGNLTIENGAILNCGDLDLTIHGDIDNDGELSSESGSLVLMHDLTGTITGSGSFNLYDLERVGPSGLTDVQTNLVVENNFSNDDGEMDFGTNSLTVNGNVITDGKLSFDPSSLGLIMSGTEEQVLTRTGSGRSEIDVMTIDNGNGVTIPAGFFEFVINHNLRMQRGVFALTGNLLEMASGSQFTPVNAFGETNMIVTGGAFANFGLLLHVPANSTNDVFVPLGIDRYMPINLDFSEPGYSSGSTASSYLLRLNQPENGVVIQDSESPNPEINDKNNVLGMFFSVDGSNIGNGLNMDLKLQYDQQYVQVTAPYTEADYIAARVLADETTISKLGQLAVDETNNILTFNLQGDFLGDEYAVDGDYFAGIDDAIPNTILEYYTIVSGNDVDEGLTTYDQPVPGGGAPSGALVRISSGHDLVFNIDGVNFYRTVIESGARLTIDETNLHRLGKVTGTGTIQVNGSGILPAGDYTDFFGCSGGKLEFKSAGQSFEILSNMPPINEVTLRGPLGTITIADSEVNICNDLILDEISTVIAANNSSLNIGGDLVIQGGTLNLRQGESTVQGNAEILGPSFFGNFIDAGNFGLLTVEGNLLVAGAGMSLGSISRETHIKGNVEKTTNPTLGSFQDGNDGAKLIFNGSTPQTITGDFTGASDIPSLELDNATGLTIDGTVEVSEELFLTDGNIFTDGGDLIRLTSDATQVTPVGGQPTSFVDGPMEWTLSATAAKRIFPLGAADRHRPLGISNRTSAQTWEVQYYDTLARVESAVVTMDPDPFNIPVVETVSIQEYWRVESETSPAEANIELSWGDSSAVSTNTGEQSNLLVMSYNDVTDQWDSYGGTGFTYDAPTNTGTVTSTDQLSFSTRFITLGSSDGLVNPLPVTWLYFEGENSGKDNILRWATASEQDNDYFVLERSFDTFNWIRIAEVEGAGNSSTTSTYSYTDTDAPYGIVYYRLSQVDFMGDAEFAPHVISLKRDASNGELDFLIYPNPSQTGLVQFRMSKLYDVKLEVAIIDMAGKVLKQEYVQVDGQGTSAPVDCNFDPGIYLFRVTTNNKMLAKPLVITK